MDKTKQRELLDSLLRFALGEFYKETQLLTNQKGMEQACVFRIGHYLQKKVEDSPFYNLHVDCEYNKVLDNYKKTPNFPEGIRPDLLMHIRGEHEHNKLAIEFKGWWNNSIKNDVKKLKDLTNPNGEYKYLLGAFVKLGRTKPELIYYYVDGEESTL